MWPLLPAASGTARWYFCFCPLRPIFALILPLAFLAVLPAPRPVGAAPDVSVNVLAWSPDGKTLAAVSRGKRQIALWDGNTGSLVRQIPAKEFGHQALAFSPDGSLLVDAPGAFTVRIWDARTGALHRELQLNQLADRVAWSPAGKELAIAGEAPLQLWDVATSAKVRTFIADGSDRYGVSALAWSPDGRSLITSAAGRMLRIWDVATGAQLKKLEVGPGAFILHPDGRRLASSYNGKQVGDLLHIKGGIQVWDLETGNRLRLTEREPPQGSVLAGSRDGKWLAWNSGQNVRLENWEGKEASELRVPEVQGQITALAWSPGGRLLAAGTQRGGIVFWEVPGTAPARTLSFPVDTP